MTMVFNAHRYSGNLQQALEINDEILGLIRQHGLEGQPILMSTLSNRAMLLPLLDRHDEAGDLHRQALELTLARYPADGLRVARQRMFYGMALVQASQFDDALAQLTPALEVMRQKWPDNHVMTQMAVHWMGGALAGLGRYEEALPLHREAWRQTLADPGSVPARVQSTGSRLVRALGETGHCDEARTLVAEDPQQRSDWLSQTPCTADTL
ncbi:MAG: tetratricopeptide repeat protein [Luteimonas sp.]|nr:tetratricopeptide repeat protein [Luteimonas sp.]